MLRGLVIFFIIFFASISYSAKEDSAFEIQEYDYIYGSNNAKVQIFEYFSLSCPHCEHFYSAVFPKIKTNYIDTGKIAWVKRSYAIDFPSISGSALLHCVGKENYEIYLNILLTKQSSWVYQKDFEDRLKNIAGLGGMSSAQFNKCMKDKKISRYLKNIVKDGKTILKISGTPALFLNKKKIDSYSYKALSNLIDEEIRKFVE